MSRSSRAFSEIRRLNDLPLFADDATLGCALLGAHRAGEWRQMAPLLEARGLPTIDKLMGGRYVPAIKAFFDHLYGLDGAMAAPLMPDGVEELGTWKRKRKLPA